MVLKFDKYMTNMYFLGFQNMDNICCHFPVSKSWKYQALRVISSEFQNFDFDSGVIFL